MVQGSHTAGDLVGTIAAAREQLPEVSKRPRRRTAHVPPRTHACLSV